MRIIQERSKVTTACAGMEGYDAELMLEDDADSGFKTYYVHANSYQGEYYTLSEKSRFDFITGLSEKDPGDIKYLEEYNNLEDAKGSKFFKYFKIADELLNHLTDF